MMCSECKFDAELREITNIFLINGYPEGIMKTNIRLKISKINEIKTLGRPKCHVYMRLSWIGSHNHVLLKFCSNMERLCY